VAVFSLPGDLEQAEHIELSNYLHQVIFKRMDKYHIYNPAGGITDAPQTPMRRKAQ
jgi:hypothetical protein